jgi:hypothetical protein
MVWKRSIVLLAGVGACLLNSVSFAQQTVVNEVYTEAIPSESAAESCSSCGISDCGCDAIANSRWHPGAVGEFRLMATQKAKACTGQTTLTIASPTEFTPWPN